MFTKLGVASRADLSTVRDQIGPAAGIGEVFSGACPSGAPLAADRQGYGGS